MAVNPDVVVGIDFGMTSTGVAYSAGPEWMRPETIQQWPGNPRGGIADKVDTKISYDRTDRVSAWGFMVDAVSAQQDQRCEELFKLYLDPEYKDPFPGAPSCRDARTWFTDYLACVYNTITRHLNDTLPKYTSKRIEFRFSVPTTWRNPAMIAEMEQLIRNAGFGSVLGLHTVEIALTEAEAAAVYASKQHYEMGDVFLVCDAGGGTSDVNVLKVTSSGVGSTELKPLSWVEGRAIGSSLIDFQVEKLVADRLKTISDRLNMEPEVAAWRMLRESSKFESFKCNLGDETMGLPEVRLSVPGLGYDVNMEAAQIEDGQMIIKEKEVADIFDAQTTKIVALIDDQLANLQRLHPDEVVTYLILSGGLGSSPYLQNKLRDHYRTAGTQYQNARTMQILKVPKPQLAVCHGLVLDRVQQIKERRAVYKERYCRLSYGVVVRRLYDPVVHEGEPTTKDQRDNQIWAEKQIDWFMVKGQKVSVEDGFKQRYTLKVQPGRETIPWNIQIVMSTLPPNSLPTSLSQVGVKRVCLVESQLPHDMKLKNRHWYNFGPKYLRAEFDFQVLIGPANLKFQTLSKQGVISTDHETIKLEWSTDERKESKGEVSELDSRRHTYTGKNGGAGR